MTATMRGMYSNHEILVQKGEQKSCNKQRNVACRHSAAEAWYTTSSWQGCAFHILSAISGPLWGEPNGTAVTKGQWCKVLCCLCYWREQAVEQAKVIEWNHLSSYWWPGTEWQHESIPAVFIWDWCSFPDCKVIVLGKLSKYGGRNASILHGVTHVAIWRWCQWPVLHQQKRKDKKYKLLKTYSHFKWWNI